MKRRTKADWDAICSEIMHIAKSQERPVLRAICRDMGINPHQVSNQLRNRGYNWEDLTNTKQKFEERRERLYAFLTKAAKERPETPLKDLATEFGVSLSFCKNLLFAQKTCWSELSTGIKRPPPFIRNKKPEPVVTKNNYLALKVKKLGNRWECKPIRSHRHTTIEYPTGVAA